VCKDWVVFSITISYVMMTRLEEDTPDGYYDDRPCNDNTDRSGDGFDDRQSDIYDDRPDGINVENRMIILMTERYLS
jgi:hypothetical protein